MPYALRLMPYALCLAPYALRLTPYALCLAPYALRLTPYAPRPTPDALRPTPYTSRLPPCRPAALPRGLTCAPSTVSEMRANEMTRDDALPPSSHKRAHTSRLEWQTPVEYGCQPCEPAEYECQP
eukprot:5923636-Prymnesium_polylepis.1